MPSMDDRADFAALLGVFMHYGFRRTSMDDLARALGVSRQTLYNRFGTKEAVLAWTMTGAASQSLNGATLALADPDAPVADAVLAAFARWEGDHAGLLATAPHSAEIMDMGMAALSATDFDPVGAFRAALTQTLLARGAVPGPAEAEEAAFTLTTAAKGLLITAASSEAFEEGMRRIIAAVLRPS